MIEKYHPDANNKIKTKLIYNYIVTNQQHFMTNNIKNVLTLVLDKLVSEIANNKSRFQQVDDALIVLRAFGNNYDPLAELMGIDENMIDDIIGEDYREDEKFFEVYIKKLEDILRSPHDSWDAEVIFWYAQNSDPTKLMVVMNSQF